VSRKLRGRASPMSAAAVRAPLLSHSITLPSDPSATDLRDVEIALGPELRNIVNDVKAQLSTMLLSGVRKTITDRAVDEAYRRADFD
jgi:hypothetical protein